MLTNRLGSLGVGDKVACCTAGELLAARSHWVLPWANMACDADGPKTIQHAVQARDDEQDE